MSDPASAPAPEPVQTADEFLALVKASGLVAPSKLGVVQAAVAQWQAAPGPMPEACHAALVAGGLLTEWHIQQLLKRAGKKHFFLDKLKLLKPLGKGGMGSVYLAELTTLDMKRVAVKLLPKKLEGKGTYLKRFQQENWAAARLNHDHIARAWDDFDEPTDDAPYHYSVMDYIEGEDLDKLVRRKGRLTARDAAEFINHAALGLHHAHGHGFVHRDIKPANLIVDTEGQVKILDFGLVQTDEDDQQTKALKADDRRKVVVGTPDYISPEQAQGKPVDCRSDIYSLGCTLYFLLTGRAPFDTVKGGTDGTGTRTARMQAHVTLPTPNLLEKRPNLPPKLVALVQRMMAKEPRERPQSAQDVADELFLLLMGEDLDAFDEHEAAAAAGGSPPPSTAAASSASTAGPQAAAAPRVASGIASPRSGPAAPRQGSSVGRSATASPARPVETARAETPAPSSAARSTGRMPAAGQPAAQARPAGTATAAGVPSSRPQSASVAKPTAPAAAPASPAETEGWLTGTVAGLPVVGWLVLTVVLVAAIATVAFLVL